MSLISREKLMDKICETPQCRLSKSAMISIIEDFPEAEPTDAPLEGSFVIMGDTTLLNTDDWMRIWEKLR